MNVRKGDRVRVVLEDTVHAIYPSPEGTGTQFVIGDGSSANIVNPQGDHVKSVEITRRRAQQVGDVIQSRLELRELPINSVVVNNLGNPMTVRPGGTLGYYGRLAPFAGGSDRAPYRVVYIPE